MISQPHAPLAEMQSLLRGVSRSFYISIRLLPVPLQRAVGLAYLLARAADTVADTPGLPAQQRQRQLAGLATAFELADRAADDSHGIDASLAHLGQDAAERRLMAALPQCLRWLRLLSPADRQDVRTVLRHITHGQSLDLQRFSAAAGVRALRNAGELHEYTYLVAGCVGEFWTDLCLRHVPDFAVLPPAEMRQLGRQYGMGLQLVNVLRDAGDDLAAGRCYLPADELAAAGLAPDTVRAAPALLEPVWARWHNLALQRMEAGIRYAQAVNSRRLRVATVLPALLGARTLGLLQAAGPAALARRVKVPRREVRAILLRLGLTLAGRAPLATHFLHLREAPTRGWDNPAP